MLSGLILAGGRSSRMGRDKAGLILPDGRTLLQRQVEVLREAGATTVLVSIRAGRESALPGVQFVPGLMPDAGPLAGIAAGLCAAPAGLVLVLAVDMPVVQAGHLRELVGLATAGRGVVPVQAGQCEPLAAVYPTILAASAEAALAAGRLAVQQWAREEAAQARLRLWETPREWAGVLRSWNTPADVPAESK